MTDQKTSAGLGEIAGTVGLTVYGDVGGNMQTVLSYTVTGEVRVPWPGWPATSPARRTWEFRSRNPGTTAGPSG